MKVPGPQFDILLPTRIEKVQVVGAQSPTVKKVVEVLANIMSSKVVTILHKYNVQ